jgi:hypothetical protein
MSLINRFHRMESEELLFQMGKDVNCPAWDIVRYSVYLKYYYPEQDRDRLYIHPKHPFKDYINIFTIAIVSVCRLFFTRGENVVIASSRSLDSNGKCFDKSAMPIIKMFSENCMVLEPALGREMAYDYFYDFNCIFKRFYRPKLFPLEYYSKINDALIKHLEENKISYEEINDNFHTFQSDYKYYKVLFNLLKTRKLFVATGNPKAILLAAKEQGVKTFLLQHAGIEFDEIDYSYPESISIDSNILFPDTLLTLGDYWCKGINVPAKNIIAMGNDLFYLKPAELPDNTILIISTIVHGGELKLLTKKIATIKPDAKFVYKLHPNEYQYYNDYTHYFKLNKNVTVLTNQVDVSNLIARSRLVVLIVSAVLYEALNQNKKVAVYKKINYMRQLHLSDQPNVYFIDDADEVIDILNRPVHHAITNFFKPTDFDTLKEICLDSES